MGSWFSSPASAAAGPTPEEWPVTVEAILQQIFDRTAVVRIPGFPDANAIARLANLALKRYNADHPGAAEFYCPGQLTREMDLKAACIGFRGDLWYHLNFLAPPWGGGVAEMRPFFAELRFQACYDRIVVETCTILEKASCNLSSSCTLCPDESTILHPNDYEVKCGKQRHEKEFFHHRCGMDGRTKVFFSKSQMLNTPFMQGADIPRYRLDYVEDRLLVLAKYPCVDDID